jgi:chromosome segregation protein
VFLKKLEMQGFKSFAERTRLELGRGITAIVGPNGSGKSNISDSIRWVLGEQSARSLRGDTMQDVIFAGSDGKGPLGMASVSLTLGDCMGYLSLDFDEVTVSRRVYRSGESQYLINKSPCRLRDIRDLFLDTGLGREGYYLIEQGQIDAILHARAEERRMIIEQAAGIGKYRVRKNEARKKLIDTEAKLIRLEDIINELNRQLQPLGKAATKAKMYLNLTQEYASKGQAVCAYEWTGLTKESQQLQERKSQLLTSLATLEKEQRQEEATIAALRQEMEKLEIHVERLQELRTRSIEAMGEIQQQQTMAKERLKHIEADGNRLKEQLVEYGNRRKEVRKELAACLWHLRSIRRRRAEEARRMEELVRTQTHQQSQRQKLLEEREKIGVTQESLRHTMAEVQAELEASLSRKALWQEQIAVLSHRLEEIRGQNEAIGEELLRQETALSQARQELASGHSSLAVHRQSHVELQSRWSSHQDLVNSWQEKLRTQTSRFQALVAMEKDYVGYYRGVRAVMQARERLSGICGTVAELIQVPRDLEIAIEIALGSSLQNIVTETDVGARQAVSYLKEKQAGRATFLPLDGLRPTQFGSRERALLERDGVVGLASDLIGYDPRHEAMVQYLLGRVVVTKDLDTAVALSRNLHSYGRIVTVDGDTISPGGAITGGSIPQKEKNGLLQRRQQVSRLAKAIQASEAALKKEQEKAKSLTEDLRQSDLQIKTLAEQLHQTELGKYALKFGLNLCQCLVEPGIGNLIHFIYNLSQLLSSIY